MSYMDVYSTRLDRFGANYQERIENQRKKAFDEYIQASVYKISFLFGNTTFSGVLEPNKQDYTKTTSFLLTQKEVDMSIGSTVNINDILWMIIKNEYKVNKGYTQYTVVQLNHEISWTDRTGQENKCKCFLTGSADHFISRLRDSGRKEPPYGDPSKHTTALVSYRENLLKQDYVKVDDSDESYIVVDFDKISTPGVIYFSLKDTLLRDESPIPQQGNASSEEMFWLNGGK